MAPVLIRSEKQASPCVLSCQLAPVSLGGSSLCLSLRAAWLWGHLCFLVCCFGSSELGGVKMGTGDLPMFCDKMMCQGKMRTEQSLASEQLFPFKSEYAGNKSSLHCLREQPRPRSGVLASRKQGTDPWARDFGWPRSLLLVLLLQGNGGAAGIPPLLPRAWGYERFSSEYPEFCAKTKSLSNVSPPTSAEPLDLGCSSCGTPFHDQGGPVEILPFLYLGSAYHAARRDMLDALGITALLNVSSDCPNHFEGHYQYKCIPVEDNHKADISSWFMEAIEYIDSVKECCGRVLVHCQAGISRSATICLAYLMMKKRVKLEEAFEFVKQRRSIISPNFSFMGQLLQFESQVLATSYAVEAVSPSGTLRERGKATSTPTSQFVFSFPVSVGVHATPSSLPYLHSPITTSPSC
uniref:Dual specificity phosphatase 4 n=1 Tax=Cyanistes caeruleus TaxID=156563 RepID=A0A8C0USD8_CYACU